MSLNSGVRRIIYNTRERLLSTDPNNAQAYAAKALADHLRFIYDADLDSDVYPGFEVLGTGSEVNRRAWIMNGVRFEPLAASTSAVVSPGEMVLIDTPAPPATQSIATVIDDPGVQALGVLVLTPGAGSTRIDVVEVQPSSGRRKPGLAISASPSPESHAARSTATTTATCRARLRSRTPEGDGRSSRSNVAGLCRGGTGAAIRSCTSTASAARGDRGEEEDHRPDRAGHQGHGG